MKHIGILLIGILCLAGCQEYDIDEILLQREEISLTVRGTEVLVYDPATFQLGFNGQTNEFRIFSDDLGNWFSLKCESRPSAVGESVKGDIKWTSTNTTRSKNGVTFHVEKTDSDGHIWLWCKEEAIGVVVREL